MELNGKSQSEYPIERNPHQAFESCGSGYTYVGSSFSSEPINVACDVKLGEQYRVECTFKLEIFDCQRILHEATFSTSDFNLKQKLGQFLEHKYINQMNPLRIKYDFSVIRSEDPAELNTIKEVELTTKKIERYGRQSGLPDTCRNYGRSLPKFQVENALGNPSYNEWYRNSYCSLGCWEKRNPDTKNL